MDKKDQALYEAIRLEAPDISKKWFEAREKTDGSVYAKNAGSTIQKELKEQHLFTIYTIASGFLPDQAVFKQNLQEWTEIVVNSRLEWDTPIYEVIAAINKTRNLIWDFITEYSLADPEIDKRDILHWSTMYHSVLDTMISEFSTRYYYLTRSRLQGQEQLIEEIDAPIIPISKRIAVLPLIGAMDEKRAKSLLESIPVKCTEKQVSYLVMDFSGMKVIDTFVANQLFSLTQSLQLLGIQSVVSGMRPETAQTAIQLGLDFGMIQTFHGLPQALKHLGVGK
ncbi:STAS domain-containing protein [Domibacillus robiginosus]|uniref:STAS domain-containing protein n=1 Tax=Domibacillus robiginosus TaxID=1071054 RepID=UPI000B1F8C14|nr:STAS domain-containing protein [Domibacillus robiginosus]